MKLDPRLSLVPIVVGLLFAALMGYLAIISTEKARDHYKSQKTMKSIQRMMRSINPNNVQPPVKEKNWFVRYEIRIPLFALPLLIVGIRLLFMLFPGARLPDRNPLGLNDAMRRSLLAMVCSFILSPAFFLIYIWSLRIGLIE